MDEQKLLDSIRAIVKEETQPLYDSLASLNSRMDNMKSELDFLEFSAKNMDSKIDDMEHNLKKMKYKIKLFKFMQKTTFNKLDDMHYDNKIADRTMRLLAVLIFILVLLFIIWLIT